MQYRKATKNEYPEILMMYKAAVKAMEESGIYQWDDIYPSSEIMDDIKNEEMHIGLLNGEIATAFTLNSSYDEQYDSGNWAYKGQNFMVLHRLCVNPLYQKMGIAEQTGLHIEEILRSKGFMAIRLDTFSKNPPALRLYDKLGYTRVGEIFFSKGLFYLFEKEL